MWRAENVIYIGIEINYIDKDIGQRKVKGIKVKVCRFAPLRSKAQ